MLKAIAFKDNTFIIPHEGGFKVVPYNYYFGGAINVLENPKKEARRKGKTIRDLKNRQNRGTMHHG